MLSTSSDTTTSIQKLGESRYVDADQRRNAWEQLGTGLDPRFTAEEAMDFAKLSGWNVRKVPLQTAPIMEENADGQPVFRDSLPVGDKFATIRNSPNGGIDVLGVVGNRYTPIQNEEHALLLDTLIDESGAKFDTAGADADGRQVFLTMKLPNSLLVGGQDLVEHYIAAFNSHDGTSAFRFMVTPVRVKCANMASMAKRHAASSFSVRHTRNSSAALAQAREALQLTYAFMAEFEEEAHRMIETQLNVDQFKAIVDTVWNPDAEMTDKQEVVLLDRRADLIRLFLDSPTNKDIRGTRWAGYNAFTEYVDHFATVRGKRGPDLLDARARNAIGGGNSTALWAKDRAFDLLSV